MFRINREVPIENLISRQIKFWQKTAKESVAGRKELLPNITISKQPGSKALEIASAIAKRLNWQVYDKQIVDYVSNNSSIRKNVIELFDEKTRSEMDEFFTSFLNKTSISKETYLKHLVKTISAIGRHGNSIIMGRGANFILTDKMALKVCIIEEFGDRQANLSRANAGVLIADGQLKKQDHQRISFLKKYFNKVADNPFDYDVLLNMSRCELKAAVSIIIAGVEEKFSIPEEDLLVLKDNF